MQMADYKRRSNELPQDNLANLKSNENNSFLIQKYSLFSDKESKRLLDNICEIVDGSFSDAVLAKNERKLSFRDPELEIEMISNLSISEKLFCTICNLGFSDREEQVVHYKSDLHRFNLKQKLNNRAVVSVDDFENLSGISSISGSDSDQENDDNESNSDYDSDKSNENFDSDDENYRNRRTYGQIARSQPKIAFKLNDGNVVVMFRCLIHGRKNIPERSDDILNTVRLISHQDQWCIILINAGHFAAAIFKGDEVVVHKTFHRYVIRAKRGTVQSVHDDSGRHAKSAGANIRRSQEAAFKDDIKSLMDQWKKELDKCRCIFLRAPKYNQQIFFAGRNPIFTKIDTRIRHIPFITHRPTFNETKRVHILLKTLELYNSLYLSKLKIAETKRVKSSMPSSGCHDSKVDDKSELSLKELEKFTKINLKSKMPNEDDDDEVSNGDDEDDRDSDDEASHTVSNGRKLSKRKLKPLEPKSQSKKTRDSHPNPQVVLDSNSQRVFNEIYSATITNDAQKLAHVFAKYKEANERVSDSKLKLNLDQIVNHRFDSSGGTLLHLASAQGYCECVWVLLLNGADPTIQDLVNKKVPYLVAKSKSVKDKFRRFMNDYPLIYDYDAAKIPSALSLNVEVEKQNKEREKKRVQRKMKREREQEAKAMQKMALSEADDRRRFLALTDEEKRLLVAERGFLKSVEKVAKLTPDEMEMHKQHNSSRILAQIASGKELPVNANRCWLCAECMDDKVPFEYFDFKFCSTKCLKHHRQSVSSSSKSK